MNILHDAKTYEHTTRCKNISCSPQTEEQRTVSYTEKQSFVFQPHHHRRRRRRHHNHYNYLHHHHLHYHPQFRKCVTKFSLGSTEEQTIHYRKRELKFGNE
jgi:hypothetical protein